VTTLLANLTVGGAALERTEAGISSLIDTWVVLSDVEVGSARRRRLNVLKSRGMAHSSEVREFRITSNGIDLGNAAHRKARRR
ncbi:MAG TPA: ATPase domain-containing protein, partial [Burkholderiales bacterium]|nr:ATPase domain-containing protein [Burkholderiales bacterium]